MMQRHIIFMTRHEPEGPRTPKRRRIAHFQADASSSRSGHPQFHAPPPESNSPLPCLDPPAASDLPQSPVYTRAIPSGRFVDDVLLRLHTRTHQATDESDNEDSEDASGGDAAEAANSTDPETDGFSIEEDVDTEDEVDPRKGIVSDWDLLAEEFIVEAEELGKFLSVHSYCILHESPTFLGSSQLFCLGLRPGYPASVCDED